jgi:NTE family protein
VRGTRERRILRITPTEKSWGPHYLRFGVDLEASEQENEFALRAAYHRKWINRLGGEWLSGAQIGERASLFTEFYQPLDARQPFFVEPAVGLWRDKLGIYQDDNRIAQYQMKGWRAALNVGVNIDTLGQIRFGRAVRKVDSSVETGATFAALGPADFARLEPDHRFRSVRPGVVSDPRVGGPRQLFQGR